MNAGTRKTSELLAGVRLVIFDADDTLRRTTVPDQPCPHAEGEWKLIPGVRECLTGIDLVGQGIAVGVASNQDHVGYGLIPAALARELLREMIECATDGAVVDPEIRFCPHPLERPCDCRKPAPGMLLDIMRARDARPDETLFVGNADSDREAARRAGVRFVWASEFFASPLAALT
jgi:D-glycero-D-manno-heptose 1,7-bisphosphate phosphatase